MKIKCSIEGIGKIEIQESEKISAKEGYYVIEVKAAGICGSDVPRVFSGSWNYDFTATTNDWQESIQAIADGKIFPERLITHKFPFYEADRAFAVIGDKKEFYNKIMAVM
ncbi:MAG: hypothetical protein ACI3XQ_12440 [Eubacteriales bacterium]